MSTTGYKMKRINCTLREACYSSFAVMLYNVQLSGILDKCVSGYGIMRYPERLSRTRISRATLGLSWSYVVDCKYNNFIIIDVDKLILVSICAPTISVFSKIYMISTLSWSHPYNIILSALTIFILNNACI